MTALVVDASITAAWCFEDEDTHYARDILSQAVELDFFVPSLWPLEMANVLLAGERPQRLLPPDTRRAVTLFRDLDFNVDQASGMQAYELILPLARAYGLTACDASYLELAIRKEMPLATQDRRLEAAAQAAGIPLF